MPGSGFSLRSGRALRSGRSVQRSADLVGHGFPALFTAGISLVDTNDGVLMLGAYGWAFATPIRKLHYNLTITFVSVLVALIVGGIEALGLIAAKMSLQGPFWSFIADLNEHFGALGYFIIAVFVVSWLGSIAVYRINGTIRSN